MLHHVVSLRVPDPLQAEELAKRLNALAELIPEIRSYTAGVDIVRSPNSYDVGLHSTFDDADALERYRVHPAHQDVLQFIREVSSERVAVDWTD